MRLLAFLLAACSLAAAQLPAIEDGGLSLTVIPDRQAVAMNEVLRVKVEVMNISRDPVLFYMRNVCFNPGAGLTLRVTDANGKALKSAVPLNCIGEDDSVPARSRFVRLLPDAFFGRLVRLQVAQLVTKPGDYLLEFHVRPTLSNAAVAEMFGKDGLGKNAKVYVESSGELPLVRVPLKVTAAETPETQK